MFHMIIYTCFSFSGFNVNKLSINCMTTQSLPVLHWIWQWRMSTTHPLPSNGRPLRPLVTLAWMDTPWSTAKRGVCAFEPWSHQQLITLWLKAQDIINVMISFTRGNNLLLDTTVGVGWMCVVAPVLKMSPADWFVPSPSPYLEGYISTAVTVSSKATFRSLRLMVMSPWWTSQNNLTSI